MEITPHTPSRSPLLRLPPELRGMIYDLLVPDIEVVTSLTSLVAKTKWKSGHSLRDDGSRFGFAVLLLNRQIHAEVLPIWYGFEITQNGLNFLTTYISPPEFGFPSTLQVMKSMELTIHLLPLRLRNPRGHAKQEHYLEQDSLRFLTILGEFLSSGNCAVKMLRLILIADWRVLTSKCGRDGLGEVLESNLKPLRGIKGLEVVTTKMEIHHGSTELVELPKDTSLWYENASRRFFGYI
jgi:hypothetical protein